MAQALLDQVIPQESMRSLNIVAVENWEVLWPRPDCYRQRHSLYVRDDGIVEVVAFVAELAKLPSSRSQWWHPSKLTALTSDMPLSKFMAVLISHKMVDLARQVMWKVGYVLQQVIKNSLQENRGGGGRSR